MRHVSGAVGALHKGLVGGAAGYLGDVGGCAVGVVDGGGAKRWLAL